MKAEITDGGGGGSLLIDGVDISSSVRSYSLDGIAGEMPDLRLRLALRTTTFSGEVLVDIPPETHDALVAIGWTPPTT